MTRPSIRDALARETPLVTPLAHDALSARLIELAGFHAFAIGGSALLAASSQSTSRPAASRRLVRST
jgi:2-methylisocitrate lyase-like PEP mutase family enzyme